MLQPPFGAKLACRRVVTPWFGPLEIPNNADLPGRTQRRLFTSLKPNSEARTQHKSKPKCRQPFETCWGKGNTPQQGLLGANEAPQTEHNRNKQMLDSGNTSPHADLHSTLGKFPKLCLLRAATPKGLRTLATCPFKTQKRRKLERAKRRCAAPLGQGCYNKLRVTSRSLSQSPTLGFI